MDYNGGEARIDTAAEQKGAFRWHRKQTRMAPAIITSIKDAGVKDAVVLTLCMSGSGGQRRKRKERTVTDNQKQQELAEQRAAFWQHQEDKEAEEIAALSMQEYAQARKSLGVKELIKYEWE
jgi:hypothetical protein